MNECLVTRLKSAVSDSANLNKLGELKLKYLRDFTNYVDADTESVILQSNSQQYATIVSGGPFAETPRVPAGSTSADLSLQGTALCAPKGTVVSIPNKYDIFRFYLNTDCIKVTSEDVAYLAENLYQLTSLNFEGSLDDLKRYTALSSLRISSPTPFSITGNMTSILKGQNYTTIAIGDENSIQSFECNMDDITFGDSLPGNFMLFSNKLEGRIEDLVIRFFNTGIKKSIKLSLVGGNVTLNSKPVRIFILELGDSAILYANISGVRTEFARYSAGQWTYYLQYA